MDEPPPVFAFRLQRGVKIPLVAKSNGPYSERLDFQPGEGDVVVCAYPSSGEDMVRKIVISLSPELSPALPGGEQDPGRGQTVDGDCNDAPSPQVHTTHLPFCRARWNPRARYVLVVRNPKQVCVSFFYYYNKVFRRLYGRQPEENCSFNTFYRLFIGGKVAFGDYFVHLRSWLELKCVPGCPCDRLDSPEDVDNLANPLVVTYEDLECEFRLNVHRIAQFLGALSDSIEGQEQKVRRTQRMLLKSSSVDSSDGSSGVSGRKMGLAGGWESHFSREHRNDFDEWVRWNGNASIYNKFWFDAL